MNSGTALPLVCSTAYSSSTCTGSEKHRVKVTDHEYTVGQLQQALHDVTQVPVPAQKIIFKGILSCFS